MFYNHFIVASPRKLENQPQTNDMKKPRDDLATVWLGVLLYHGCRA
ncbi:MAG TPA: hypothetical protein VFA14_02250 [Herbaspirillum sp.]|nr:hypothetical protein [Herbaspirillum sp.]